MTILVSPLSRVPEVIAERKPARVISLLDPTMAFPETGPAYIDKHLRVEVHDIVEAQEGWLHPTEAHVDELLKFIAAWDEKGPILIHCYAGISRSTATAFVTACLHNPDTDEMIIARELREASPTATPNRRIVQLADLALGRKGRMLHAVESIGRGASWAEIGEAEPFALRSFYGPAKIARS
ncbi:MAG: protein-tyrosine phosphatase family protein [Pseudomonadota bacterium]